MHHPFEAQVSPHSTSSSHLRVPYLAASPTIIIVEYFETYGNNSLPKDTAELYRSRTELRGIETVGRSTQSQGLEECPKSVMKAMDKGWAHVIEVSFPFSDNRTKVSFE